MHVRIVLGDDRGDVYVDADTAAFTFRLKGGMGPGGFGVYASQLNVAYFANFAYRRDETPRVGAVVEYPEVPAGTVTSWLVSDPYQQPNAGMSLPAHDGYSWRMLESEEKGITNLARGAAGKPGRTVLARVTIGASSDRVSTVRFGYSDRVQVYLNGTLLYRGDNSYVTRDYRYLGTIGLFDELVLPLRRGENELVFEVSETFGGWGIMAQFPDTDGLRFGDGVVS